MEKRERIALFPGSFDPVTCGHLDLIRRGSNLFDRLVVGVLINPAKKGCFTVEERVDMLKRVCGDLPNVEIAASEGMTVDLAKAVGADCMLRGVRSITDYENERTLAELNRRIAGVETLLLFCDPTYGSLSSSAVRELASFDRLPEGFVPDVIYTEVLKRLKR